MTEPLPDVDKTFVGAHLSADDHRILLLLQNKLQLIEQRRISTSELLRLVLRRIAKAEGIAA